MGDKHLERGIMLDSIPFRKSYQEIKDAAIKKVAALKGEIEGHLAKVAKAKEDNKITPEIYNTLLEAHIAATKNRQLPGSYSAKLSSLSGPEEEIVVSSSVMSMILDENEKIEQKRRWIAQTELVARNIGPNLNFDNPSPVDGSYVDMGHLLSHTDLIFLGF